MSKATDHPHIVSDSSGEPTKWISHWIYVSSSQTLSVYKERDRVPRRRTGLSSHALRHHQWNAGIAVRAWSRISQTLPDSDSVWLNDGSGAASSVGRREHV